MSNNTIVKQVIILILLYRQIHVCTYTNTYIHIYTSPMLTHTQPDMLAPTCIYIYTTTLHIYTHMDMLKPMCIYIIAPKYVHPEAGLVGHNILQEVKHKTADYLSINLHLDLYKRLLLLSSSSTSSSSRSYDFINTFTVDIYEVCSIKRIFKTSHKWNVLACS